MTHAPVPVAGASARSAAIGAAVALLGALLQLAGNPLAPLPAVLRLLVAWTWIILAPGWLAARAAGWIVPRAPRYEEFAVATATGLGLAAVVAWLSGVFRMPLAWTPPITAGLALVLATREIVRRRRMGGRRSDGEGRTQDHGVRSGVRTDGGHRVAGIMALVLLAGTAMVVFRTGATVGYPEDALAHVAAVRAAMSEGRALPHDIWYRPGDVPGPDPRFGVYHGLLALLATAASLAPIDLWILVPGILAAGVVAAYMTLVRSLWASVTGPLLAGLILFFTFEGEDGRGLRLAGDPMGPALLIAWVSLALFLRGVRGDSRRLRVAGAVLGAAAGMMHVWGTFQALFAFALFALGAFFARHPGWARQGARAVLECAAWSLLYLGYRYFTSFHPANPANWTPQGILRLGNAFFVLSPFDGLEAFGIAGLASFLVLPWLVRAARHDPGLVALASGMGFAAITLPNPLLMPVLFRILSYLAIRVKYLALFAATLAWAIESAARTAIRERGRARAAAALALLGLVAVLLPAAGLRAGFLGPSARGERSGPLQWERGLRWLEEQVRVPAIVATDAYSAYAIPAFTRHRVVAIPWEHASPNDSRPGERLASMEAILSPYVGLDETLALAEREDVDLVLLNKTHRERHEGYGFSILPDELPLIRAKFDAFPEIFPVLVETGEMVIYDVCAEEAEPIPRLHPGAILAAPPIVPDAAAIAMREGPVLATYLGGIQLRRFRLSPDVASHGETVLVECFWEREGASADAARTPFGVAGGFPRAFLRLDRAGTPGGGPLTKLERRLRQQREQQRFRFRARHTPLAGLYPPDRWPAGEVVHDPWTFVVPSSLAPGRYDVRLALLPMELVPTFELRDFTSDQDRFAGMLVGSFEVRP